MAKPANPDPFEPWIAGFSYEQAFDGTTWVLTRGEDFDQSTSTVAAKLRAEFERRFGALDIKTTDTEVAVRCLRPKEDTDD